MNCQLWQFIQRASLGYQRIVAIQAFLDLPLYGRGGGGGGGGGFVVGCGLAVGCTGALVAWGAGARVA